MKHLKMKRGGKTPFGMLSVKAGIDNNPNPTQADRIAGATDKAACGMKVKEMGHRGKMDYMGHGGKMDYMGHGGRMMYDEGGKAPFKIPDPEEQVRLQENVSKVKGHRLLYDEQMSKAAGEHRYRKAEHGAKMPEYAHGGMMQGEGGDVNDLLEMLANYDQNAPIGEFLQMLMKQSGMGEAMAVGGGAMAAGSAMRNLPPRDVESLLRQLSQQGR